MKTRQLNQIAFLIVICGLLSRCHGQTREREVRVESQSSQESGFTHDAFHSSINSVDTSSAWTQSEQKILLTGSVYQNDGKTPAPDVVLYYYHTNLDGKYIHKSSERNSMPPNDRGQTHGYIRGWVKTDSHGKYFIYTVKPGAYPTRDEPAHIHMTVKEPNEMVEYYIDDFVFDDDKRLTSSRRRKMANRGGSGVLQMVQMGDLLVGERDVILGMNIPDYQKMTADRFNLGINIGEDVPSFRPHHAWGPDRGTRACPVCKYGWYHGILYFVGDSPDWNEIKQWLSFLEEESIKREKYLKVYFVYGNQKQYDKTEREMELGRLGRELKLNKIALTFVPTFSDSESEVALYKINQDTENTFILYRRSRVVDKFVNLKPSQASFSLISKRLDQTANEYFDLPKPER